MPKLRFPEFSDGWEVKKFDEIFLFSTGKNIKQNEASPKFETPCVRYGELYHMYNEVINEVINKTNLDKSELLFSEGNEILLPSAGEDPMDIGSASALTIKNVAIGRTINILKPLKANFYSQIYVAYYINHKLKKDISKLAKGVSISNVYNSDLKTLEITLCTLPEQQKIATFLSTVDEKLKGLKKKKSLLEIYKKGVMQKLFSQKIRFKDDEENEFDNWEVKKLGETCEIIGGGTPDTINPEYWNGNIQWFTPTEIKSDYVSKSIRTITELGLQKSSAKKLPIGTILLTTRATIGEASIALEECTTNQGFQSLIVKEGINNLFVFNWIKENKHELTTRANGSTFPEISKTEIEKIQIPIPSFQEQTKIANFLMAIDEKITNVDTQIKQTELWKKGLLQQMFV